MTPAQQAALEVLAKRPLTAGEIALATLRNDAGLAGSLSEGRTKVVSKQIGRGTILAVMAPAGGLFIAALRDIGELRPRTMESANVAESVGLIDRGEFDVGLEASRAQLQLFAASNEAMAPGIAALLDLGVVAAPILADEVSAILNREA